MAVNKRKILETAQKFLQKGALDKALREYKTLLDVDPRDSGVRLKLGDIHLRLGEKDEAVGCYLKVAQQFMKDGFDAKAVALYKQIGKLAPEQIEIHVPLAELYQRLGLTAEAMTALQNATEAFQKAGRKREALDLLRKMAALDPTNTTSRLKIGDLLRSQGLEDEALNEYEEVARELARAGEVETLISVHERVLELDPRHVQSLVALGRIRFEAGENAAAAELAERAVEARPEVVEAHELLAEALAADGREEALEPVHRRLADLYRSRGDEARAREILQRFVSSYDLTLGGGEAPALTEPPRDASAQEGEPEVLDDLDFEVSDLGAFGAGSPDPGASDEAPDLAAAPGPELTEAPLEPGEDSGSFGAGDDAPTPTEPTAGGPSASSGGEGASVEPLLAEAGVYLRFGKLDRAVASLESALERAPDHPGVLEKLGAALLQRGDGDRAAALLARAETAARGLGDAAWAERIAAQRPAGDHEDGAGSGETEAALSSSEEPLLPPGDEARPAPDGLPEPELGQASAAEPPGASEPEGDAEPMAGAADAEADREGDREIEFDVELDLSGDLDEDAARASAEEDLPATPGFAELRDDDTSLATSDSGAASEPPTVLDEGVARDPDADADEGGPGREVEILLDAESAAGEGDAPDGDEAPPGLAEPAEATAGSGIDTAGTEPAPDEAPAPGATDPGFATGPAEILEDTAPPEGAEEAAAAQTPSAAASPKRILEDLEEADFYFQQGLLEEAEAVYRRVLELAPTNPQAQLRLGEIAAARGHDPGEGRLADDGADESTQPGVAGFDHGERPEAADDVTGLGDELVHWDETAVADAPAPALGEMEPLGELGDGSGDAPGEREPRVPEHEDALRAGSDAADAATDTDAPWEDTGAATPLPATALAGTAEAGPSAADEDDEASRAALAGEDAEPSLAASASVDAGAGSTPPALRSSEPGASDESSDFDLAAELTSALGMEDTAASSLPFASEESFESIFQDFKRGVSRTLTPADHETHYDLGIAYHEMGLLEDALGEFQVALASPERRLDCLQLMALCARDLERPHDAVSFLQQALAGPDLDDARRAALQFDLGHALRAAGQAREALAAWEQGLALDPSCAGLAEEIQALRDEITEAGGSLPVPEEPEEVYESFDDLIADAESSLAREEDAERARREDGTEGTDPDGPAPDGGPGSDPSGAPRRRRRISFG